MYDVENYMQGMIQTLNDRFAERLLYVGLQGSYLRGEATENSDIDITVIIDHLTVKDLAAYKTIVESLPNPEKACGFICGRQEIAKWNPLELCNFLCGTKDCYGKLADYVSVYTKEDVVNFIKLSVGNLYHELCHRYIHGDTEKNKRKLPGLYKNVFFILQSLYYLKDGVFYPTKAALMEHLVGEDRAIMEMALELSRTQEYNFESAFELLLAWCQSVLAAL